MKKLLIPTILLILASSSYAATWQGTSWIGNGLVIDANKTKENQQFLYDKILEVEGKIGSGGDVTNPPVAGSSLWSKLGTSLYYNTGNIGIGTSSPTAKLHVVGGSVKWGTAGILKNDQGASMELGGTGTPYLDFKNNSSDDYDMRLILTGNDKLKVDGGNLEVSGTITTQGKKTPTGWGGGLTTFDIYSDNGSIGIGRGGAVYAYMNNQGNIRGQKISMTHQTKDSDSADTVATKGYVDGKSGGAGGDKGVFRTLTLDEDKRKRAGSGQYKSDTCPGGLSDETGPNRREYSDTPNNSNEKFKCKPTHHLTCTDVWNQKWISYKKQGAFTYDTVTCKHNGYYTKY